MLLSVKYLSNTHVLTHALHYGSGVFEGIRAYTTPKGPAIFKANEHYQRLIDSCNTYIAQRLRQIP